MRDPSLSDLKLNKKQGTSVPIKKKQRSLKNNSVRTRSTKKNDLSLSFVKKSIKLSLSENLTIQVSNSPQYVYELQKTSYAPSPPCAFSTSTFPGTPDSS